MSENHISLAAAMLNCVENKDLTGVMALFTEEAVFFDPHYPKPRMQGHAEIKEGVLWGFNSLKKMRFNIINSYAAEDGKGLVISVCTAHEMLNGQALTLRPQSLEVLHLLASKPDQVVSKDEIFKTIWNGLSVTDDSLVQCIVGIRRALSDDQHQVLQTLSRRGYRLVIKHSEMLPFPEVMEPELIPAIEPPSISSERTAIAVMSFKNNGADHIGDVIAVGLSTDIHSNLAKMSRLFVVAQASASRIQHLFPREIGQQLGVSYLVAGSTQRSDKTVRATVSLVETESNQVLWTEQYERPVGNFFQLQDDITLNVVAELDHLIEQEEIKKAFSAPPDNLNAWELYHQGLWYCTQGKTNLNSVEKASQLLKQSLALDPTFAPAYAALSSIFINRIFLCTGVDANNYADKALECAQHSLSYDHHSGWGYWALGRALHMKKQSVQALYALNLSIKYKPNFSWNHYTKAMVSTSEIKLDDALPAANQALRLSPVDPNRFAFLCAKTMALIQLENYEEAAIWGVHAANEPRAYHLINVVAALALKLAEQTTTAEKHLALAFKQLPGFCLQNYRRALPHDDEASPDRVRVINTLKALGVPETSQ